MTVKEKQSRWLLHAENVTGTSHWVDFTWDNPEVTFADILEVFGELPIPPYLNRETQESDKETYQTVYSKIKDRLLLLLPDCILQNAYWHRSKKKV